MLYQLWLFIIIVWFSWLRFEFRLMHKYSQHTVYHYIYASAFMLYPNNSILSSLAEFNLTKWAAAAVSKCVWMQVSQSPLVAIEGLLASFHGCHGDCLFNPLGLCLETLGDRQESLTTTHGHPCSHRQNHQKSHYSPSFKPVYSFLHL